MDPYQGIAEFYDCEHGSFRDDIDFYLDAVREGPLLEVGTGTGRVLEPLARAGHEVWGVDSSPAMLLRARERLAPYRNVHLVQTSVVDLDLSTRFRTALLPLNTLWHLPDTETQLRALRTVHHHMEQGGRLIVDVSNPHTMADRAASGEMRQRFERETADGYVVGSSAAWDDEADQTLSLSLTYDVMRTDGTVRRVRSRLDLRYVYRFELELLLKATGFALLDMYGWYDLQPYTSQSPNLIAVAEAR